MHALHTLQRLGLAVVLLGLGFIVGCNKSPHSDKPAGSITAKVTYGGEPVTEGQVNFVNNSTGLGGGGSLGPGGTATISTVPTGKYVVTVTPPLPDMADPNPQVPDYANLPQKYRSETTSTLKAEVFVGDNEFTFELKDAEE